uniref:Transmembrane protein 135 N-terminal domain-containing protein n=1 Tax=Acrobeloides nanus TaxID=290746 RepID=A0A914EJE0_9BILA
MPAFFATMPLLYHSSKCIMHRVLNKESNLISATSGFISGASMMFYPSTSIALYVFWKCVEIYYLKLVEKGVLPSIKHGDILLYTLSTGYVLGNAFMEPQTLREDYYQFLCGLTGNRANILNRRLFEKFGFDSNLLFENFIPKLDTKFVTINPTLYLPIQPPK